MRYKREREGNKKHGRKRRGQEAKKQEKMAPLGGNIRLGRRRTDPTAAQPPVR